MKIGILTLPLLKNYGGILQAYALQQVLKKMGHEAWLVQRYEKIHRFHKWLRNRIGNVLKFMLGHVRAQWVYCRFENNQCTNTQRFIDEYIVPKTSKIFSIIGLRQDYKNLETIDCICHGIPSSGVFSEYLNEKLCIFSRRNKYNNIFSDRLIERNTQNPSSIHSFNNWKIGSISFRDKRLGWKKYCFTIQSLKRFCIST